LTDGLLYAFACLHLVVLAFTGSLPRCRRFVIWHVLNGLSLWAACSCKSTAWAYSVHFLHVLSSSVFAYVIELVVFNSTLLGLVVSFCTLSLYVRFVVLPYAG